MTATNTTVITEQEYLRLEEKAVVRHEFINGKIYEMPGGTYPHEYIIGNLQFLLKSQGLKTVSQGLRVRLPDTKDYYYPDVVVSGEKVKEMMFIETPLLIAEVLSPSTRVNDSTDKFIAYRRFPTLQYYLLVETKFCHIVLYYKDDDGNWESEVYNHLSGVIPLLKLSTGLSVAGIYNDLEWAENLTSVA